VASTKQDQTKRDHDEKWKLAVQRAQRTATWAKTMTKQLISRSNGKQPRWHVVNFLGPKKSESRGIVDLMAIRKSHLDAAAPLKKGDLFEIVLLQVKGGKAKWPTPEDRARLRAVQVQYDAKSVVLSEWKQGARPKLYRLDGDDWGEPIDPAEVFCPDSKAVAKKRDKEAIDAGSSKVKVPASARTWVKTKATETSTRSIAAKKAWASRKRAASAKS